VTTTTTATPRNPPAQDRQRALDALVAYRRDYLSGDEKGEAQVFLDRLFRALGWDGVREAGGTLEFRVSNTTGGTSFADLMWKPRVLLEMKKSGVDLSRHFRQAFDYWVRAVPDRPRYVVLCNFDEFWIYDFENQVDEPVDRVRLVDLPRRWETLAFLLPQPSTPSFGNDLVAVTRKAAADVAEVFLSMKGRGVVTETAQRFVLQCVMAMFSEDIGLLPGHLFTSVIQDSRTGAESFDLIGGLFREMNTPGLTAGGRFARTPYFNGGLFANVSPQELNRHELDLLRDAAKGNDWSDVRPEIFGTLFEGSMDAGERHARGAHFTSQVDIARIVGPVIVRPWRERIEAARNIQDLRKVLHDMSQFRVLDPACGSGNFLYVAYREMRRLEREALNAIVTRRTSPEIAAQQELAYVSPEQFHGIDNNPFAVEVAKVTLQLGKKLAADELHEVGGVLPLDNLDSVIVASDALFSSWPRADVIIGNPPFMGRRSMVEELGANYCSRLDERFGPKGVADFVTYWFPKAHDHLPDGGRAGFVGTKSIKQSEGRKASLDYVVDNGGVIVEAVSHMPWSGDAAVTVSIVNWQKGGTPPRERTLWLKDGTEPIVVDEISSALSLAINLRSARNLDIHKDFALQGQTLGLVDVFRISGAKASSLIRADALAAEVIHPILGGDELLKKTSVDDWVIDLPDRSADDAWRKFPAVMGYLGAEALPLRQAAARKEHDRNEEALAHNPQAKLNHHHAGFLDRWWTLGWRREELLRATAGMTRYVALTRTSSELRGPVFSFVDGRFHVTDGAVAFPVDDDYSLGILQSNVHESWFRERCSTFETRLRYTSKTVSLSFPWPQDPDQTAVDRVSAATVAIVNYRAEAFRLGQTLASQYDTLRLPGRSRLRSLHEELNAAVMEAYAFDQAEDVLTQLLELNLLVAQREDAGERVTAPGALSTTVPPSTWAWPAPSLSRL
jgi:hypothetical protein